MSNVKNSGFLVIFGKTESLDKPQQMLIISTKNLRQAHTYRYMNVFQKSSFCLKKSSQLTR